MMYVVSVDDIIVSQPVNEEAARGAMCSELRLWLDAYLFDGYTIIEEECEDPDILGWKVVVAKGFETITAAYVEAI